MNVIETMSEASTTTLPTVGSKQLTKTQRNVIIRAINSFSEGGHPPAGEDTLDHFTVKFAQQMLRRVTDRCKRGQLNKTIEKQAHSALKALAAR